MTRQVQHWIPRFLIRNFSDTDGRVYKLDKKTDEIRKIPPKDAAAEVGFYEFVVRGEQVSFEKSFEQLETLVAPIISRIVKSKSIHDLSQNQRLHVAKFIAAQSIRAEAFQRGYSRELDREKFGSFFDLLWNGLDHQCDQIFRRKWIVMSIESAGVFYLGDQPVTLQYTEDAKKNIALGVDVSGVELFMPLSPTYARMSASEAKAEVYKPLRYVCFGSKAELVENIHRFIPD